MSVSVAIDSGSSIHLSAASLPPATTPPVIIDFLRRVTEFFREAVPDGCCRITTEEGVEEVAEKLTLDGRPQSAALKPRGTHYDREIVINVRNVLCTNSIVVMKNELRIHIYYHQDTHLETLLETLLEASSVDEGAFFTMADDLLSNSPKLSMVLEPSDMLFEDSLAAFGVVSFWWFVSLGTWQPELVDSFFSL